VKTTFYTGKGDKGSSALGKRKVRKDNVLFHALGTLDELNTWLGLCKVEAGAAKYKDIKKSLHKLQEGLFVAQAEVAATGMGMRPKIKISKQHTKDLESEIKEADSIVPPLKNFVIPGGSELGARLDVARAISRRLERTFVAMSKKRKLRVELLQYLNRLSSVLFAFSQLANHIAKAKREHPTYK